MPKNALAAVRVLVSALSLLLPVATLASDPPDSRLNPVNGCIQVVDATWTGASFDVRHVTNRGGGHDATVENLTTSAADDLDPKIAIGSSGDTWVVWERTGATGQVVFRTLSISSGTWSPERVLSAAGENARNPRIVHDGVTAWVAYETAGTGSFGIRAGATQDDPNPYGTLAAATTGPEAPALRLSAESGRVWTTWIDDAVSLGWSAYDAPSATWSVPAYEPIGADGVAAARDRVRATVLEI